MERKPPVNSDRSKQADRRRSARHSRSGEGSATALVRLKNLERDRQRSWPVERLREFDVDIGDGLDCGRVPSNKRPHATYQPSRNGRIWPSTGTGSCSALEALIRVRLLEPASDKHPAEARVQAT
jgi:hypothetical protein